VLFVDRWHLPSIDATGKREPRVLFSQAAWRGVVIDLQSGESMGEHQVHENAVVEVVSGRVAVEADGREVECDPGTLVVFEPGERHAVRAVEASRVLLLLAPWPGKGHYQAGKSIDPERLPLHARSAPIDD
jgi:quercetin dioxygenase-like cupin family protein